MKKKRTLILIGAVGILLAVQTITSFAWAGILIIAAVFLALIVLTFTGGPENVILALLFCVIVIPVMLYGYALILKYVRNKNKRDN